LKSFQELLNKVKVVLHRKALLKLYNKALCSWLNCL